MRREAHVRFLGGCLPRGRPPPDKAIGSRGSWIPPTLSSRRCWKLSATGDSSGDGAPASRPAGCGRSALATWPTPPAIWTEPSVLWTVSVPCKPSWKNRRRTWMGGWRPSSRPQATLPSSLDDDDRHVVCLGARGPLADLAHEGGNDSAAEELIKGFAERNPDSIFNAQVPEMEAQILLGLNDFAGARRALTA